MKHVFVEQDTLEPLARRADAGDGEAALALAWYLRQSETRRALALVDRLSAASAVRGPHPGEGRAALIRGEAAIHFARLEEAAERLAEGADRLATDKVGLCDVALARMLLASARGDAGSALAAADDAASRAREAEDPDRAAIAAAHAAVLSIYAAPTQAAARIQSLEGARLCAPASILLGMAQAVQTFNRGDHAAVVRTLQEAAEGAERLGMLQVRLRISNTIAAAYSNLDDKESAISWVEGSLERARAAEWPVATGEALAFLGNFYREAGHAQRAIETLDEARQVLSVAPESRGFALACCYLAHAQLASGQPAKALEHAQESEAAARKLNATPIVVDVLTVAARAEARLGRPLEAAAHAHLALAVAVEEKLATWEVDALRALAEIHGDARVPPPDGIAPGRAPLHFLERARAVLEAHPGHAERVNILRELARAREIAGDAAAALEAERAAITALLSEDARRINNRLAAVEARHLVEKHRLEVEHQRQVAEAEAARARALGAANAELRLAKFELERLANTDALTGLANRRAFLALAEAEVARGLRFGRGVGLIMADIDRFKQINDTFGHPGGDRVIVAVARALEAGKRAVDGLGRLGGEEFALLLPEADLRTTLGAAERLRAAVEAAQVEVDGRPVAFTMSFGAAALASTGATTVADALESLMRRADDALYQAKAQGRNRAVAHGSP